MTTHPRHRCEVLGNSLRITIPSLKVYSKEHISQMRTDVAGSIEPYAVFFRGSGVIAFGYKDKTIRVGIGVNEAEAKEIVAEIQWQYPQYQK